MEKETQEARASPTPSFIKEVIATEMIQPKSFKKNSEKKLLGLLKRREFRTADQPTAQNESVIGSCFAEECKNKEMAQEFDKSRLVIQTLNGK